MKKFIYIFTLLSSAFSCLISIFCSSNIASEFSVVILYPLLYGLFFLLLWPYLQNKTRGGRITVGIFLFLQWLRLVLLPALGAISGYFVVLLGATDESSAFSAGILVIYESIVTFLTAFLILRYSKKTTKLNHTDPTGLAGHHQVYILYVFFALALFFQQGANNYSFFMLDLDKERRVPLLGSDSGRAASAMIDYGLTLLVILLLSYCVRKYARTENKRYMYYALLVAIGRICIISSSSEGRLSVLYPAGAFLLLLPRLFKKYRKTIVRNVVIVAAAVIGFLTLYKVFRAFLYGSYLEAFQNGLVNFDAYDAAGQLDSYFYGVRNISKNLYVSKQINLDLKTFVTDFGRNTFGLHYLFGDVANTTLGKYNLFLYGGQYASGNLYSSLAYGAAYFTVILAPVSTVMNMLIVTWFENWLKKAKHLDSYYFISVVYIRMAYNIFACFPMAWNYASRTLVLSALVIGGASMLKKKRVYLYTRT